MNQLFDICKSYDLQDEDHYGNAFRLALIRWINDADLKELTELQTTLNCFATLLEYADKRRV